MEKFLFIKKLDTIPQRSRFLSLPHKQIVMIYTLIQLVVCSALIGDDGIRRRTSPALVALFFALTSFFAFVVETPSRKVQLLKFSYLFSVILVIISILGFTLQLAVVLLNLLDAHFHIDNLWVLLLVLFGFLNCYAYAISLLYYIKELEKESGEALPDSSEVQLELHFDTAQTENKFLFIFPKGKIVQTNQFDRCTFYVIFDLCMAAIFYGISFLFDRWEDHAVINLTFVVPLLLALSIYLKNTNLVTMSYYLYSLYALGTSIFVIVTFRSYRLDMIIQDCGKLVFTLLHFKFAETIFCLMKIMQTKEKNIRDSVLSTQTQTQDINIPNINAYYPPNYSTDKGVL